VTHYKNQSEKQPIPQVWYYKQQTDIYT